MDCFTCFAFFPKNFTSLFVLPHCRWLSAISLRMAPCATFDIVRHYVKHVHVRMAIFGVFARHGDHEHVNLLCKYYGVFLFENSCKF